MNKKIKSIVVLLAVNLLVASCATNAKDNISVVASPVPDCVFPNTEKPAPDWICDVPLPGLAMQAVGVAEKSKAGMSYMRDLAKLNAQGDMVEQYRVNVDKRVKAYLGSTGIGNEETIDKAASSTKKSISSGSLRGAKVYRSRVGPDGRLYMLIGLSPQADKALMKESIRTSMKNDQALWQEFKAQKSHDEMAADIAKMR